MSGIKCQSWIALLPIWPNRIKLFAFVASSSADTDDDTDGGHSSSCAGCSGCWIRSHALLVIAVHWLLHDLFIHHGVCSYGFKSVLHQWLCEEWQCCCVGLVTWAWHNMSWELNESNILKCLCSQTLYMIVWYSNSIGGWKILKIKYNCGTNHNFSLYTGMRVCVCHRRPTDITCRHN